MCIRDRSTTARRGDAGRCVDQKRTAKTVGWWLAGQRRMKITTFDEFKDLAQRGTFVPVYKEIVADLLTPVSAFLKIAEHSDYAFLLESVEGGEQIARYSFLGKDPVSYTHLRAHETPEHLVCRLLL